ncbi:MAG: hypothetical protein ACE5FZ_00775 [Nitrospiria bacterium]
MLTRFFFVLGFVIYLTGVCPPVEAGMFSPGQALLVSEDEKSGEWLDLNGQNKAWWMNQIAIWKEKREKALSALHEAEEAFKRTRFKNYSTAQKRIERKQLREEIQAHREKLQTAEMMLHTTLPENGRRAGVPSGWFR